MLVIAASISASLGFGFFLSSAAAAMICPDWQRSEEHTSELQSQSNLVCRLLLEKKNRIRTRAGLGSEALQLRGHLPVINSHAENAWPHQEPPSPAPLRVFYLTPYRHR